MKVNTKYRIAMIVITVLCVACVALGAALFKVQQANDEPLEEDKSNSRGNYDALFQSLNRQLQDDRQRAFHMLDGFFDDDFFTRTHEPFKEMEKMHHEMLDRMGKSLKGVLDDSWDAWFENRFTNNSLLTNGNYIKEQKEETKDAYIYRFTFPSLQEHELNVKVGDKGITIEGEFIQSVKKTNEKEEVIAQHEVQRSIYEHVSIPQDVDVQKAEVNKKKNEITVRLPKKTSS